MTTLATGIAWSTNIASTSQPAVAETAITELTKGSLEMPRNSLSEVAAGLAPCE